MPDSEFDIEPTGDGIVIHLPFRKLDGAYKLGWIVIAFATFMTLFMAAWIATPVAWGVALLRQGEMFGTLFIAFGCFGFGGLFFALKVMAFGVALVRNRIRCSVIVDGDRVVNHERFGWFGLKTRIERSKVETLFVAPLTIVNDEDDEKPSRPTLRLFDSLFGTNAAEFYLIRTEKRKGRVIAPLYSREILDSVAAAIVKEINRDRAESVLIVRDSRIEQSSARSTVTVQHLTEEEIEQSDYELPANSTLQVIEKGESTVYQIPTRSLRSGTNGLFTFSVIWNGFMVIFSVVMLGGFLNGQNGVADMLAIVTFILVFWAVGIGMLVGSIYMARQSAMIGVKEGLLFIERKTIFGTKWTEFEASQIDSIKMGHANFEVNNVPVKNLQVKPFDAKAVCMFAHLDNQEIKWLAQQLSQSLGVLPKTSRLAVGIFDPKIPLENPDSTDIVVSKDAARTTIFVPARDFPGGSSLRFAVLLFVFLPVPVTIGFGLVIGFDFMFLLFSILSTIVGVALFVGLRTITTREFHITATDDQLEIRREGFLSNSFYTICRADLLKVDVSDSGAKVNNHSLYCVTVNGRNAKTFSMMTGRDETELAYVAGLIHQQMTPSKPATG